MNIEPINDDFYQQKAAAICLKSKQKAQIRQANLTKPQGSLGRLENIAIEFAGFQGREIAQLKQTCMLLFAADHGLCAENISAFEQAVSLQMLANFTQGGAAINQLCTAFDIPLYIINAGCVATAEQCTQLPNVEHVPIALGTDNLLHRPAMSEQQAIAALKLGALSVLKQQQQSTLDLLLLGEMGIGNTAVSSVLSAALTQLPLSQLVGSGTGLSGVALIHKQQVLEAALKRAQQAGMSTALDALRQLGGFEIAAMAGAYIQAAQLGIASLVDGFIASTAALLAVKLNPSVKPWLLFAHCSQEQGHRYLLDYLQVTPLLDLGLRLGEGTGAALALPIAQQALNLHENMATFKQAAISQRL